MLDKNSIAFLVTPPTPRARETGIHCAHEMNAKRLASTRHRSTSTFFSGNSLRHSLVRPLTAFLGPSSEAPRIDRVRLRPLQADSRLSVRAHVVSCGPAVEQEASVANSSDTEPMRKSSKFCMVDGCTSRAKHARRCWKHGGSVKCKIPGCVNRAKSKGVCWSHGGGSPCSVDDCDTIAVSNGFCWAHGGGKRCRERGCSRPAYERTHNYCVQHFEGLQHAAAKLLPSDCHISAV